MANVLGELFSDIAQAIRGKTGDTATMKPAEFPAKIAAIEGGGGGTEIVDGVDPYYLDLAETLMVRDATRLTGDAKTLSLKGFIRADGSTIGNLPAYSFAGFRDVENMVFSDVIMVNEYALRDCGNLKILDITAGSQADLIGFAQNSLAGCSALETVILRSGGAALRFASVNASNGANETFYVYVPAADYDTIVGNLSSNNVPASRYRKLEDYPAVDRWNERFTVNFYDGDTLVDTKVVKYGETATTSYNKPGYTLTNWTPEPVNVTEDMDCYGTWSISFADADWQTIATLSESGEAASVFKTGDTKTFTCNGYTLTAQIAAMGVDNLADGTGKAGITCVITKAYPVTKAHSTSVSNTAVSPWSTSSLRSYCNDTIYNGLEESLKAVIKPVNKISQKGSSGSETTQDYCWALGAYEVGGSSGYESSGPRYSAMFPDANSRKRTASSGSAYVVWNLRGATGAKMNHYVTTSGSVTSGTGQNTVRNFLFGFCI